MAWHQNTPREATSKAKISNVVVGKCSIHKLFQLKKAISYKMVITDSKLNRFLDSLENQFDDSIAKT